MKKFWILFMLSVMSASSVFAEDCATIDVRERMNPELKAYFHTAVDQGPIGWCFAHAASDMMAQAIGTPISATYTGSYYSNNMNPVMRWVRSLFQDGDMPEGGFTHVAIKEMQSWGRLCKASVLTSQGVLRIDTREGEGTGKLSLLFTFLQQYRQDQCTGPCASYLDGLIAVYLPQFSGDEVKKYLKETASEKLESVTFHLFDEMCKKDPILVQSDQFTIKVADQNGTTRPLPGVVRPTMTQQLDKALLNGKVVGIEYDASYIDEKLSYLYRWHASTVIGREKIGQACYYRVRNTWNKDFQYNPGILWDLDRGTYLVDRATFRRMAVRVLWIE